MIGSSVIALSHVEEGTEEISEQKMSPLNTGVMHVTEQTLLRKAVTFRNAQVIDFISLGRTRSILEFTVCKSNTQIRLFSSHLRME